MPSPPKKIILVAFPGVNLLDVAGPAQVFTTAAEVVQELDGAATRRYEVELLSVRGGLVTTTSGVELNTDQLRTLAAGEVDTILIAGGHGSEAAGRDVALKAWLPGARQQVRRLGSICTGAFVLAGAGMLNGKRVATHWAYCDRLQATYPDLKVERDAIFLEEGGLWSSAGVTSGVDLALAMVEQDLGREIALLVARKLVVFMKRAGGQAQFSIPLRAQAVDGPLAPLLGWISENLTARLTVDRLASRASMSERTLFRLFKDTVGLSPAEWVEEARTENARRLLEDSHRTIEQVATQSGFGTAEHLRRVFVRRFGVSPTDYRDRFSRYAAPALVNAHLALSLAGRA